ncbi:integral membrane protein [Fusarium heterosporum]|uniref:Integral membrane protein n=1 Tax=Fusarium heterosporum TaxID=42747 RepID=A0A8H5TE70_FUSHE|nr:integral membrane protein [Fusarium heterosporum]
MTGLSLLSQLRWPGWKVATDAPAPSTPHSRTTPYLLPSPPRISIFHHLHSFASSFFAIISFCRPLSSRLELKIMVEKYVNAPGRWIYTNQDNYPHGGMHEACFCPCIVYARARFRLAEAEDHRNGFFEPHSEYISKAPTYPVLSNDCFAFASCCLPCEYSIFQETSPEALPNSSVYAPFIIKLRRNVRQFYNIRGTKDRDFYLGCFYPCYALLQIEREIDGRQTHRSHNDCTGYNPEPPMSSSSSESKTPSPGLEHCKSLASIPENRSESTSTNCSSQSQGNTRERSIAQDPLVPDAILVQNHDIAKDPMEPIYETIKNHKLKEDTSTLLPPSIHQLRADSKAPASPPAINQHDLFQDAGETYAQPSGHDIGFDRVETFRASPGHQLFQDKMTPGAFPISHDLDNDMMSRATSPQPHALEDEVVRSNRPHKL